MERLETNKNLSDLFDIDDRPENDLLSPASSHTLATRDSVSLSKQKDKPKDSSGKKKRSGTKPKKSSKERSSRDTSSKERPSRDKSSKERPSRVKSSLSSAGPSPSRAAPLSLGASLKKVAKPSLQRKDFGRQADDDDTYVGGAPMSLSAGLKKVAKPSMNRKDFGRQADDNDTFCGEDPPQKDKTASSSKTSLRTGRGGGLGRSAAVPLPASAFSNAFGAAFYTSNDDDDSEEEDLFA